MFRIPARKTIAVGMVICGLTSTFILAAEISDPSYTPPAFEDNNRLSGVLSTESSVTDMYRRFAERTKSPGLVYAVVLDGKIVYSGGFGFSSLASNTEVSDKTLFRVASMSKVITAQAILQLRDAGKLSLSDPISLYIPQVGNLLPLTTDSPQITIRHLLTHTAGFPEDNNWADRQLAMSDEDFIELIQDGARYSTVTGHGYEYSNVGYSLLGQIVQNVSGLSFEDYTSAQIFEPLEMNSTVWEFDKADPDLLAMGYGIKNDVPVEEPLEHHGAFGPMAGLITSIEDFAKYAASHLNAWPARSGDDSNILKRSSLREMHQPHRITTFGTGSCPYVLAYTYGLNWAQECDTPVYITHNGGLPGFGSNWLMAPEHGLAIMSFTNRTYMAPLFLNVDVLQHIIEEAGLQPRAIQTSPILIRRQTELVALLPALEDVENSNIFAKNFFLDNDATTLTTEMSELFNQIGPIVQVHNISPANQLRGTFVLEGEIGKLEVFFSLTPESEPLIQTLEVEILEE
ncbi:MAG: CubicO group peptidase (beta-lactamase class C family) [Candidatus Azotimanducaceae bacterium]|jgi:CubicO group peptidase (beta-lactamase class C family)